MTEHSPLLTPLSSDSLGRELGGGKASSLSRLLQGGFSVPQGFCLTRQAYFTFIQANDLSDKIQSLLSQDKPFSNDEILSDIRSLFCNATLPRPLRDLIVQAHQNTFATTECVAVRSSASFEDSPQHSFAGQMSSFLNICDIESLLDSIVNCWTSLWNQHSIQYQRHLGINPHEISMAVIIQRMVQPISSGVLFTANPATGARNEILIDACYGLGEALVSGAVTPDHYVVDRGSLKLKSTTIGAKKIKVVADHGSGKRIVEVEKKLREQLSLSLWEVEKLAQVAIKIESLFNHVPQDIEWSIDGDGIWILQSRAITRLPAPPLPDVWQPPPGSKKLIRRQIVENMPEPLSPLFDDLYLAHSLEHAIDQFFHQLSLPTKLQTFLPRPFFVSVNGYAYCKADFTLKPGLLKLLPKLLFWAMKNTWPLLRNSINQWKQIGLVQYLEEVRGWHQKTVETLTDQELLSGIESLANADARYWVDLSIVVGMSKITDELLHRFLTSFGGKRALTSGMLLQGFSSPTLEAQAMLASICADIRNCEQLRSKISDASPDQFWSILKDHNSGPAVLKSIERYCEKFGHQIYNLDFSQKTQGEDLAGLAMAIVTLIDTEDIDWKQKRKEMQADRLSLQYQLEMDFGPLRRRLLKKLLSWAQHYGPFREQALFYIGFAWPTLRRMVLELGRRRVTSGHLLSAEEIFYLTWQELKHLCLHNTLHGSEQNLTQSISSRMLLQQSQKRLHPPGLVPLASAWKIGPFNLSGWQTQKHNTEKSKNLEGFAVSPGTVTGIATVILSRADFSSMEKGTILICPTTTPAWTPLFSLAIGLVTDIGGILAHGSIIAREYGIPAVMGTGNGTLTISTGQKITVDGNSGMVTLLD